MTADELRRLRTDAEAVAARYDAALTRYVAERRGAGLTYYAIGDEVDLTASYLRGRKHKMARVERPVIPVPRELRLPDRHYHSNFQEA